MTADKLRKAKPRLSDDQGERLPRARCYVLRVGSGYARLFARDELTSPGERFAYDANFDAAHRMATEAEAQQEMLVLLEQLRGEWTLDDLKGQIVSLELHEICVLGREAV